MSAFFVATLRCQECGDVIGVYEPMVLLSGGVPVRTSRTVIDAGGVPLEQACFHAACFARRELC